VPRQFRHTLDCLFQVLVRTRDIAPVVAKDKIEEALRLDGLQVDFRIRGGVRSEKPLRAATAEELEQAKQAADEGKPWSWDFLSSFTPPKGEAGRVHFDGWGPAFALVIKGGKLVVEPRCALDYPWDAYSFTVANWPIIDELWPTKPTPPATAPAHAPAPAPEVAQPRTSDALPRRKPGPKIKHNWRLFVAAKVHQIREKEGGRTPGAPELAQICEDEIGYQPDVSDIQKLLRILLSE